MHSSFPSQTNSFVIYDLETTGLRCEDDEFIQIAAIRYYQGRLCAEDSFFSFARPRKPIPSFIESYTGVGNQHVNGAPRPEEVLIQFSRWAGRSTLIAHNGHRFDSKFLEATCRRHGLPSHEVDSIDSIHLSKMLFGKARGTGHSLDHLKDRLQLKETNLRRHDARGDVDILGRAVEAMRNRLGLDHFLTGVPRHRTILPIVPGPPNHGLPHYPSPTPQNIKQAPPAPQHYRQAPPVPQHYVQKYLLNCPFCMVQLSVEHVSIKTKAQCSNCSLMFYIEP